ncbi:MraY family glycosyltransferase [Sediminivirga luteola]
MKAEPARDVRTYLLVLLVAAAVAYLMTPMVRRVAERALIFAPLRERDVHSVPTPRLGGVAIMGGVLMAFLVASQTPLLSAVFADPAPVYGILGAGLLLCILGVIDDIWDLTWFTKLAGQVLAAGIMAVSGVALLSIPLGGVIVGSQRMSIGLTILVVVVTINAVNFVDGLDGLAAGTVAIGGTAFFVYSYWLVQDASPDSYANLATLVTAALVGACLGFLPHNFNPARIFMGDSGSMLIGLLLAASTIRVTGQVDPALLSDSRVVPTLLPILLPIAIVLLPLADLVLAIIRRLMAGKSPFSADAKHLHHRMLALGHSHARAVLIMYCWVAVIAFSSLALLRWPGEAVLLMLLIGLGTTLVLTFYPLARRWWSRKELTTRD